MSKIRQTYDQLIKYLKGLLTNRERHEFERQLDAFDQDALEGLSQLPAGELESDMDSLFRRLEKRVEKGKTVRMFPWWRVAAAVLVVSAIVSGLLKTPEREFITEKIDSEKMQEPPETSVPGVPQPVAKDEKKATVNKNPVNERAVSDYESDSPLSTEELQIPEESRSKSNLAERKAEMPLELTSAAESATDSLILSDDSMADRGYITGRVLGINRKALAGVSISEEGSSAGTVTDLNGNFRLKVSDPRSRLELSYAGYENKELSSAEIAGREIMLDQAIAPENNLVVMNYPGKSAARSAASESKKATASDFIRPLPPGGSMKSFDNWVESRIDTTILKELLPGKYKISVRLTVYKDGKIGNLSVPADVPVVAAEEYKRVVSQSERWQPAINGNLPVDSDIMIEFSLIVK